jgi:hypothetical protein
MQQMAVTTFHEPQTVQYAAKEQGATLRVPSWDDLDHSDSCLSRNHSSMRPGADTS